MCLLASWPPDLSPWQRVHLSDFLPNSCQNSLSSTHQILSGCVLNWCSCTTWCALPEVSYVVFFIRSWSFLFISGPIFLCSSSFFAQLHSFFLLHFSPVHPFSFFFTLLLPPIFQSAYCCHCFFPTVPNWYFSKQCLPSAHIEADFFPWLNGRGCFPMRIVTEDQQAGICCGWSYAATYLQEFYCTTNFFYVYLSLVVMRIERLSCARCTCLCNVITLRGNTILIR